METLASAMRRENRRFKAPSSSAASAGAGVASGRVPLVMAFLSCLAWLYVAGRLWQDAQTRAILSGLLEKNSGNLPKVLSVKDKLRTLGCREIGRKIVEAEMDLTKAKSEGYLWGNRTATVESDKKQKLLAVIGVYTGFGSRLKRNVFRGSWMPRGDALKKLEEKGVVIRFVIGRSANRGDSLDRNIDDENRRTNDFLILESHEEAAEELPSKAKFFFSAAVEAWDAEFYVKVEDNINLDLAGLIEMLEARRGDQGLYMGCMKSGVVVSEEGQQWYEPEWWKFGDSKTYFRHASGSLFVLSNNLARYININSASLQSYAHDDISVGSWMMGVNATYADDDRFCCSSSRHGRSSYLVIYQLWAVPRNLFLFHFLFVFLMLCFFTIIPRESMFQCLSCAEGVIMVAYPDEAFFCTSAILYTLGFREPEKAAIQIELRCCIRIPNRTFRRTIFCNHESIHL